jgi:hypothetical protein
VSGLAVFPQQKRTLDHKLTRADLPGVHEVVRWAAEDRRPTTMTEIQHEALAVLAEVWSLSPDIRLGQLMAHLGFLGDVHLGRGLGYIEDDELIAILYRHRTELLARSQGMQNEALQPPGSATSVSGSSTLATVPPAAEL